MSLGLGPQLIAAVSAILSHQNPFIHNPPKSLFTKRCSTLWEPDPTVVHHEPEYDSKNASSDILKGELRTEILAAQPIF